MVPGYTVLPGASLEGNDISCDNVMSSLEAAESCNNLGSDCMALSLSTLDGALLACAKSLAGPIVTNPDNCFYTKIQSSECAQVREPMHCTTNPKLSLWIAAGVPVGRMKSPLASSQPLEGLNKRESKLSGTDKLRPFGLLL